MRKNSDRRNFLRQASMGSAALLVAGQAPLLAFNGSPNEKVVLAVMGTNGRGEYLATLFAGIPGVEIGYICEVDETVMNRTLGVIEKKTGKRPPGFKDIRKLLEQKDIDALVVAAPDHWHAPATLLAVQAGKHVYVEKPCSHNPAEGELLVKAASVHNRLIQMGNQRRSFPGVMKAMQDLRDGAIGRPYFAKGWYTNNRKSIGRGKETAVPANLDFDLWQGPAPRRAYKDNLVHYNWHWFWHWGTGEALNNGTHELDVMRWGLDVSFPSKVVSAGGRYQWKDDWETPDTQTISYEFNNNTAILWEGRSCNDYRIEGSGRGVIFYGEKGTLVIPGGDDYRIHDESGKMIREEKSKVGKIEATTIGMGETLDQLHLINFINSIRGQEKLHSPIAEGHVSTLLPQLGNIAWRTGNTLHCDPVNGHILNDKKAMALWNREYEKGWAPKL
ncbi:Gfo/Idh/MocA family protein [Flavihumibacter petaseus]|uniref:Putative glycosidase n=1 Tax=Flavihumibacter petaseus NBRC 106054 TaxID=1220578 RepID=A0A0E9N1A0_9BACT|nr:Gfo/Idh/MocA family oxidoreductase [Flavihumibacter petaseus]GAO43411.1 putative glycosidase [Flavihumibacter petaseus NBRC 106054]